MKLRGLSLAQGLLAGALICSLAVPAAAQQGEPREVSIPEARAIAMAAHRARQPDLAQELALVLIARDPDDSVAHQILGASRYALGDFVGAARAGRAAWSSADDDLQRHDAAMIVAEALYRQARPGAARWWLRRAAHHAPTDAQRGRAIRAFQGLGARQKLHTRLDFGIAPSSNINGGTSSDRLVLAGIPFLLSPDAQALSGVEARLGVSASYRIHEGPRQSTTLGITGFARTYELSNSARRAAPDADAADYAFAGVEATARHRFLPEGARGPYDLSATLGRNWYGGDPLSDYARLGFGQDRSLSKTRHLRFEAGVERQWRKDVVDRSADVVTLGVIGRQAFAGRDVLSLGVELRETDSAASSIDHSAIMVSLGYGWAEPVGPARISANVALEARDYAASPFDVDGRQDLRLTAGLSVFLQQYDYFGFAPQIDLRASRTNSNISLFDSHDFGLSFALKSTF